VDKDILPSAFYEVKEVIMDMKNKALGIDNLQAF
jgi:hypothetical protein